MAASYCRNCGAQLGTTARFCTSCGVPVSDDPPAAFAGPGAAQSTVATVGPGGKGFSIGEVLSFGWRTTWDNIGLVIGLFFVAVIVPTVISLVFQNLPTAGRRSDAGALIAISVLGSIATSILSLWLTVGLIRALLKLVDGRRPEFADLFRATPMQVLVYLGASIVVGIAVFIGLLLLIVPGVILALMWCMFPFLIVDRDAGPIDALSRSARLTKGARWDLFLLYLASIVVVFIGFLALIVGVFIAYPVVALAWTRAYRILQAQTLDA
jgi:uncharacterized membrane protein